MEIISVMFRTSEMLQNVVSVFHVYSGWDVRKLWMETSDIIPISFLNKSAMFYLERIGSAEFYDLLD